MALADEIRTNASDTFSTAWTVRDGQVVPVASDLKLSNDAVRFERATVLYADLDQSTSLVETKTWGFAAEVYKSFLYASSRLIRGAGGSIVSYDGDRVMGIFIGDAQCNDAVRCSLRINYAVKHILQTEMKKTYRNSDYVIRHVVGVDTSETRVARTGVRGDNDLVWVGNAANLAAKLTAESADYSTWITDRVYENLNDNNKTGTQNGQSVSMWKNWKWTKHKNDRVWSSTWWRPF